MNKILCIVAGVVAVGLLLLNAHNKIQRKEKEDLKEKADDLRYASIITNDVEVEVMMEGLRSKHGTLDYGILSNEALDDISSTLESSLNSRISFIEKTLNRRSVSEAILRMQTKHSVGLRSFDLRTRIETLIQFRKELDLYYYSLFETD